MAYIPLNKIVPNLVTKGNEFQFITGEDYVGKYWKSYKGEFFTGATQNDSPTIQIYPIEDQSNNINTPLPFTQNAALYNEIWEEYEGPYSTSEDLQIYNKNKKIDISIIKKHPVQSYPKPTPSQYEVGQFDRVFCYKVNEPIFLEITPEVYNYLITKNPNWNFDMFIPFRIPWNIVGKLRNIERANRNQVLLAEKKIKRKGLGFFLNFDYTKFCLDPQIYRDLKSSNPTLGEGELAQKTIEGAKKSTNIKTNLNRISNSKNY